MANENTLELQTSKSGPQQVCPRESVFGLRWLGAANEQEPGDSRLADGEPTLKRTIGGAKTMVNPTAGKAAQLRTSEPSGSTESRSWQRPSERTTSGRSESMSEHQPAEIPLVELGAITADPSLQPRAELSRQLVAEYAQAMADGAQFPPVVLFEDRDTYWLADGFHRYEAAKKRGTEAIEAEVHEGGKRDALWYAMGANTTHGLRRTNADKRRAVETLLRDEEWKGRLDTEIAGHCGVSSAFVGKLRDELGVRQFNPRAGMGGPKRRKTPASRSSPPLVIQPAADTSALCEPPNPGEARAAAGPADGTEPALVADTRAAMPEGSFRAQQTSMDSERRPIGLPVATALPLSPTRAMQQLLAQEPEQVAQAIASEELHEVRRAIKDLAAWLDRLEAALSGPALPVLG